MRREGRIHGMVRTYPVLSSPWNPTPNPRNLNVVTSPPTAGLFNKVSTKPTNHSKFTGKCGRSMCRDCHIHPPNGKSKDKSKGSKIRSVSQNGLIKGMIAWRVVAENQDGAGLTGRSGSGMLGYLDSDYDYDQYDDDDLDVDEVYDNTPVVEVAQQVVAVVDEEIVDQLRVVCDVAVVDEEIVDREPVNDNVVVVDEDESRVVCDEDEDEEDWFLVEQEMIV